MDVSYAREQEVGSDNLYVTAFDGVPGFWNYLLDLDRKDLIAELVQNDLDQGATRTEITFEKNRLVCLGNGNAVEADGWERLRMILGAGDAVPAKRKRIGVKNHGLKTAFTIGDELELSSAGRRIVQTLYAKGRDKPAYPGASPEPMEDPNAPQTGCRITIQYRTVAVKPSHGEASEIGPIGERDLREVFEAACNAVPEQFAGIVSPHSVPHYEILLRHWELGEAQFVFSCTRPRRGRGRKRFELFRRHCHVNGTAAGLPKALREQAACRWVPLQGRLRERVADCFRIGRLFCIEVSWPIDARGHPQAGTGRFRYPIGYPQGSSEAQTGHGVHLNAPFVSDNRRHAPARNDESNGDLRTHCEALLVDAIARYAVPTWGPAGLKPLIPCSESEASQKAAGAVLSQLAQQRRLPVVTWGQAAKLLAKANRKKINGLVKRIGNRRSKRIRRYGFLVPLVSGTDAGDIDPALSLLCPRSEFQLHPRTPPEIVRYFAACVGVKVTPDFITFDETDALARAIGEGNKRFDAIADLEVDYSEPLVANACLDVIDAGIAAKTWDDDEEDEFIEKVLLPNVEGGATPTSELYASAPVPREVPGLELPPVLHPHLVGHRIFRRRKWRRPKYSVGEFLASGELQSAGESTRKALWEWLRQNHHQVGPRDRPKLAGLAIWPDVNGDLCPISDLCEPKSALIGKVLDASIRRPHRHVIASKLASVGGRSKTSIRQAPSQAEVTDWFEKQTSGFASGQQLDVTEGKKFRRFESDLLVLLRDRRILDILRTAGVSLLAVARNGTVQLRRELVVPRQGIDKADLAGRVMLKDTRRSVPLDKISPAMCEPTAAMVLEALAQHPENTSALQARLKLLFDVTCPGDTDRHRLAEMRVIPVNGRLRAPSELAFRSNYWGRWKTQIPLQDLSQEDRSRYLDAGVTPAMPDHQTSRAYFEWLSAQDEGVLGDHVPFVLRHFAHKAGPAQWAKNFTDVLCVPVRNRDGIRLVSLRRAVHRLVYLDDAGSIGEDIIQNDGHVFLTIHHASGVSEPITEQLAELGVRSLRAILKEPVHVSGSGNVEDAGDVIIEKVKRFQSRAFQRTFYKRLGELDIEKDVVRNHWFDRVRQINRISVADRVEARYRFRRKSYSMETEAGFDPEQKTLWVERGNRDAGERELYRAIAAQLVFKPTAPRIFLRSLEDLLEVEITDRSFGRAPNGAEGAIGDQHDSEDQSQNEDDGWEGHGDGVVGHSPFVPNPEHNVPNPGPIPNSPAGSSRSGGGRRRASPPADGASGPEPATKLEEEQIEDLKRNQYASHCQVCLCERPPHELAPAGSYVEAAEVRRQIVHAHHVDVKSAHGARHAGNMILLCKFHHENLGRRLTRRAITEALQGQLNAYGITFKLSTGLNRRSSKRIDGQQVTLRLSDTDDAVKLFFTKDHADYWLSTWHGPD